jgi:Flp pilus assembly protein CpaB
VSSDGRTMTAEPGTAPPPMRTTAPARRGLASRASFGHLVMILSGLLAFVLVLSVLQSREDTVLVAVSRGEIPTGAAVTPAKVRWVELPADSPLLGSMVGESRLRAEPWVAARRVARNEPITRDVLRAAAAPSALRAMSIPIAPEHAVGGALQPGDRVDVIDVQGTSIRYVLQDAEVLAVGGRGSGLGAGDFQVTVAVDDTQALELAFAIADGKLEIVRSTGANSAQTSSIDAGDVAEQPEG